MGLDYSQKRLLTMASHKGAGKRAFPRMKRKPGLEVYAFWTGFASTIVSIIQVIIIAMKK